MDSPLPPVEDIKEDFEEGYCFKINLQTEISWIICLDKLFINF
jgi:hypothetical protein